MHSESVAVIPRCTECGAQWLPADEERWRAYLGSDTSMSRRRSSSTVRTAPNARSETTEQSVGGSRGRVKHPDHQHEG
jgi:hypothetical protein